MATFDHDGARAHPHESSRRLMQIGLGFYFDAGKHFKVESVPTLFLLGENGDIIYHYVGRPDPALLNALETTIQARLRNRPY